MGSCVVHCEPRISWHTRWAGYFVEGLKRLGIECRVTSARERVSDVAILLGTTCWKNVEHGGQYLLVDRCSFGDPDSYASLVWNGHGRRGDHCLPGVTGAARWENHGVPVEPWRYGSKVILCGQTDTYSPHWNSLTDWYATVNATHFRPHPCGSNPTSLPLCFDFHDCKAAVTLNSSVAVQAVISGVPTITMDEGSMAWDVTGHFIDEIRMPDRTAWLHALAWTQWNHDEICEGTPIAHLFER